MKTIKDVLTANSPNIEIDKETFKALNMNENAEPYIFESVTIRNFTHPATHQKGFTMEQFAGSTFIVQYYLIDINA